VLGLWISFAGFGVAYCAAPGVVNAEALRRGVARGFRSGLLVEAGSLLGDMVWAALALTGTTFLAAAWEARFGLGIAGSAFTIRLAWTAIRSALREPPTAAPARSHGQSTDLVTGIVFGLANPFGLAFWLGAGAASSGSHALSGLPLLLSGFLSGALLWCAGFPLLVAGGRRLMPGGGLRWIGLASGAALAGFSVRLLLDTAQLAMEAPAGTLLAQAREWLRQQLIERGEAHTLAA
jgi:threonine/homoserine/homoserine lactone efflux protein